LPLRHLIVAPIVLARDKMCPHSIADWRWGMNIERMMRGL